MIDMQRNPSNKVPLGPLLTLKKGKKPRTQSPIKEKGMQPYVDIKAFETGVIDNYTNDDKCVPCNDGDLLIVCDGSRSGYVGRAIKGYIGSTLAKISAEGVDNSYLYYFIQSMYRLLNTQMKGTGTPHLNAEVLKKAELVIPSLDEQKHVVNRIEELFSELDSAVETLKKTKEQLAVYRQSVLKDAFEGIQQKTTLEQCLAEKPRNGYSEKAVDYETRYKNLTLTATTSGVFKENCFKYIDIDIDENSYLWVKKNDILIQRANTLEYVGTSVIYLGEDNKYVYPDLIMKCSAKTEFLPQFLVYQLQSLDCRKYFREHATGTAGSMPKINQKVVCSTPIKITNKKVQREIVQYIESRFTVCDNIEKTVNETLAQAEAMRQSILKKAFEGSL